MFRGTGDVNNIGVSLDDVRFEAGDVDFIEFASESHRIEFNGLTLGSAQGVNLYAQRVDADGNVVAPAELVFEKDGRIGVLA